MAVSCVLCGEKITMFGLRKVGLHLENDRDVVCDICVAMEDLDSKNFKPYSVKTDVLKQHVAQRKQYKKDFHLTRSAGDFIAIDEDNHLVKLGNAYFKFENIIGYELRVDGDTMISHSGGVGRAIVGGLLFGAAGAIVGAATRGANTKSTCDDMHIMISLEHPIYSTMYIRFISSPVDKSGFLFRNAQKSADECISILKIVENAMASEKTVPAAAESSPISAADEILKFKQLLDANIITQEEFEAKKKQLLGL